MNEVKFRIHIVPLGFEYDRIVIPLSQMKADKVWIISKEERHDKAKPYKDKIVAKLKKLNIPYEFAVCEITDLYDILRIMREIIEKECSNDIFINVSSGSKIAAIAGMMASMIFKIDTRIIPYYAEPKTYIGHPEDSKPQTEGLKEIKYLPHYRIEQPKESLISLLRIIDQKKGAISKKELIKRAEQQKLIVVGGKNEKQSKYMSLNKNYLDQLLCWKLIEVKKVGRKRNITITKEGKNMLRFLG